MSNQTQSQSGFSQRSASGSRASPDPVGYRGGDVAAALLGCRFDRVPGTWSLRLWNGETLRVGAQCTAERGVQDPEFKLVFRTPDAVSSAVLCRDPLCLAESYFRRPR